MASSILILHEYMHSQQFEKFASLWADLTNKEISRKTSLFTMDSDLMGASHSCLELLSPNRSEIFSFGFPSPGFSGVETPEKSARAPSAKKLGADNKILRIGARVKVSGAGLQNEEGIVRFMGPAAFAPGDWVGVELLSKRGKHNGTVKGKRYFSCAPDHGIFTRPGSCVVYHPSPAPAGKRGHAVGRKGGVFNSPAQATSNPRSVTIPTPGKRRSGAGGQAKAVAPSPSSRAAGRRR
mgnify:CR=1 FL=1